MSKPITGEAPEHIPQMFLDGYWLVEIDKGATFEVQKDKLEIIQDGSKRRCAATLIRGFSFPSSLCNRGKNEITFMPVEALSSEGKWRNYADFECYYVCDTTEVTHFRTTYPGETRVIKSYLRHLGFLEDTSLKRLLDRARFRRISPEHWDALGGMISPSDPPSPPSEGGSSGS